MTFDSPSDLMRAEVTSGVFRDCRILSGLGSARLRRPILFATRGDNSRVVRNELDRGCSGASVDRQNLSGDVLPRVADKE